MVAWSNTRIVLGKRRIFNRIWPILLAVVFITTVFIMVFDNASANNNKVLGFSARLKGSNGTVAADGYYNVQFKLYRQSTEGAPLWTETYRDNNGSQPGQDNRLKVTNGYLSAKLGSVEAFSSDINWGEQLWLTMNIGGTDQEEIIANINWDGEMSPRIQLTATPYSLNSNAVGGKTVDQLAQLGQGVQIDGSNNSSLFINKTGVGDLIQLQSAGVDIFRLSQAGNLTLGGGSDKTIAVGQASGGIGHNLTVSAGDSSSSDSATGGNLVLQGGSASGTGSTGGDIIIDSGTGSTSNGKIEIGSVNSGSINIGNAGSTTTVQGNLQSDSIDTAGESTLIIAGQNATGVIIGQDTVINGNALVKSDQDNSSAFQVQNSSGEQLLTVNSAANQISIGSSDTVATTLVLDTKTSAGDPSGTDGAMYYNGHAGKFRCYQAAVWTDCVTPLPVSKVASTDTSNSTTTPIAVDDLSYALTKNTKYYYKFMIIHEADDSTTGVGFGVTTPTNPASTNWCVNTTATTSSAAPGHWGSYCGVGDASATTSGAENLGKYYTSTMEGYIETGNDPGDLKLRLKSEFNKKVTVKSGSFGILQIVQ